MNFVSTITNIISGNAILIYQMGKVGSTALEESIPRAVHIHNLYFRGYNGLPSPERAKIEHRRFGKYKYMLRMLILRLAIKLTRKKLKVITLFREPIARNVSMYFQTLPFWLASYYLHNRNIVRSEDNMLLYDIFIEKFNHDYGQLWFDEELKRITHINIYNTPFNKNRKYLEFSNKKFDVLLMRSDFLRDFDAKDVLSNFLSMDVSIGESNRSNCKWYANLIPDVYIELSKNSDYINSQLFSKAAQYFYTDKELEELYLKYTGGGD